MSAHLPTTWTIRTYQCVEALAGYRAVAHLFEERRDRHGGAVFSMLPATSFGSTCNEAADCLKAFLEAEIAKEGKRRANSVAFGERVRLRATRVASK